MNSIDEEQSTYTHEELLSPPANNERRDHLIHFPSIYSSLLLSLCLCLPRNHRANIKTVP